MRNLLLASAAALALACGATAVSGQSPPATMSAPASPAMTPSQKAMYETWPASQKTAYDSWSAEYQAYFWSLTPSQQKGWFALSDDQRKQVYEMPPASRAAVWASIEQQLAGAAPPAAMTAPSPDAAAAPPPMDDDASAQAAPVEQVQANPPGAGPASDTPPDPATADTPVPPAQPADPGYHAGPYKGALTEPPADAMNKTYPVCSRKVQDNCRNPGGV